MLVHQSWLILCSLATLDLVDLRSLGELVVIAFYPILVLVVPKPFGFVGWVGYLSEFNRNGGNHREPVTARVDEHES